MRRLFRNGSGWFTATLSGGGSLAPPCAAAYAMTEKPYAVAVSPGGVIYYSSTGVYSVFEINGGWTRRIAGTGVLGDGAFGGLAAALPLGRIRALALSADSTLLMVDFAYNTIRAINPNGTLLRFAGTGAAATSGDGGPAINAAINGPNGIALAETGEAYVAEVTGGFIRHIGASYSPSVSPTPTSSAQPPLAGNNGFSGATIVRTVLGTGVNGYRASDDGLPGLQVQVKPNHVAVDSMRNILYASDLGNHIVKAMDLVSGVTWTFGTGTAASVDASDARSAPAALNSPRGLAVNPQGDLFIADAVDSRVRVVWVNGSLGTVAGTGNANYTGEGAAMRHGLNYPNDCAWDPSTQTLVISELR